MPIYFGKCSCTYVSYQFLKTDSTSVVGDCHNCGKKVFLKQTDPGGKIVSKDGVTGVLSDGPPK